MSIRVFYFYFRMLTQQTKLLTVNATVQLCNRAATTATVTHPACFIGFPLILTTLETQLVELSSRVQILESGDLLISNIRAADAGLYICVRANEAGSVKGEAYLGVLGK